jgi:hypothetical protein
MPRAQNALPSRGIVGFFRSTRCEQNHTLVEAQPVVRPPIAAIAASAGENLQPLHGYVIGFRNAESRPKRETAID